MNIKLHLNWEQQKSWSGRSYLPFFFWVLIKSKFKVNQGSSYNLSNLFFISLDFCFHLQAFDLQINVLLEGPMQLWVKPVESVVLIHLGELALSVQFSYRRWQRLTLGFREYHWVLNLLQMRRPYLFAKLFFKLQIQKPKAIRFQSIPIWGILVVDVSLIYGFLPCFKFPWSVTLRFIHT